MDGKGEREIYATVKGEETRSREMKRRCMEVRKGGRGRGGRNWA